MTTSRVLAIATLAALVALTACDSETKEPSAAEKALDELQQQYDELVGDRLDDPTGWAAEDLENIGDWEYRVEEIPFESNEELAATLNTLGDERWEVFWIERTDDGYRVLMKKPSISYLSKIPLYQIGRFVIGTDPAE